MKPTQTMGKRVRRSARGALRRVRDAGTLLRSGKAPLRRVDEALVVAGPAGGAAPVYYGWTRYSALLPKKHGLHFRASKRFPDEAAYIEYLWSEERMAPRAALFLERSVPLLQAMRAHHDYRHVVTYSPEMPEPWLSQLLDAAARHDVLDLRPAAEGPVTHLMRTDLRRERRSRPAVWFRVDDDDLLSVDYLDIVDEHVRAHGAMWGISLGMGYEALWHDGRVQHVRSTHRPLGSHGQACAGWWDAVGGELAVPDLGNHTRLDRRVPTVLDSRRHTFLRLVHAGQDTRTDAPPGVEELRARLLRSPTVVTDAQEFLRLFPSLAGVYDPDR